MRVEEFITKASREEIFDLFTKVSRLLIIQEQSTIVIENALKLC